MYVIKEELHRNQSGIRANAKRQKKKEKERENGDVG
jgi:hypothetical protein